jgi:hypothetical protein
VDGHVGVLHRTESVTKYIGGFLMRATYPEWSQNKDMSDFVYEIVVRAGELSEASARFIFIEEQPLEQIRWDLRQELRRENIACLFIEDYPSLPSEPEQYDVEPISRNELNSIGREHDIQVFI